MPNTDTTRMVSVRTSGAAGRVRLPDPTGPRLRVDWIACDGRGLCAELLPEMIVPDDWGYPIIADRPVPIALEGHARRAVAACPLLALRLEWEGSGR